MDPKSPISIDEPNIDFERSGWLGNLNLFIPAVCIAELTLGLFLGKLYARVTGAVEFPTYATVLCLSIPIVCVVALAVTRGLAPSHIEPMRGGKYRWGHGLLATGSVIIIGSTILPFWLSSSTGKADWELLAWMWLLTYPVGGILWIVGFALIQGARGYPRRRRSV